MTFHTTRQRIEDAWAKGFEWGVCFGAGMAYGVAKGGWLAGIVAFAAAWTGLALVGWVLDRISP